MIIFETTTACTMCGNLGTSWSIKIYSANDVRDILFRNTRSQGQESCRTCGTNNSNNLHEHIRLIQEKSNSLNNTTTPLATYNILMKITHEFNTKIRKNTENKKPSSGSTRTINGTNHHRFSNMESTGTECTKCKKIFMLESKENQEQILICPHCSKEQPQKVEEDLIRL